MLTIFIHIYLQAKVMRETNSMVEEFMLAANISAAERIYKVGDNRWKIDR